MKIAQLYEYLPFIFPMIQYAELHYRFRFLPFSRYYIKEPEIIADAPYRLESGSQLPILLLIKDAHRFPLFLENVEIELIDEHGKQMNYSFKKNIKIEHIWWYEIVYLNSGELTDNCKINVKFIYTINGEQKSCINSNDPVSGRPIQIYLSSFFLPGKDHGWIWGDLHYHSWFTEDFVEFGAPPDATQQLAKAQGLSFVCLTDHSYDLDDKPGSWKETDPERTKWNQLWSDIRDLNRNGNPILIPGEEVSTFNSKQKNVHMLVLNHAEFLPGSGDGAERWFQTKSELSIPEVIIQLQDNSMAIAAHPLTVPRIFQKILLNRGLWDFEDLQQEGLHGLQILNGSFDQFFFDGLEQWVALLLEGKKKYIVAGNDAHGNFNRFRQIRLPMISIRDRFSQIMGKCRTGILAPDEISIETIIRALKNGKCVISNGPMVAMEIQDQSKSFTFGDSVKNNRIKISVDSFSSPEFGRLKEIKILLGDLETKKEKNMLNHRFSNETYRDRRSIEIDLTNQKGYIRAQLTSSTFDNKEKACYTNPIWIISDS